MKSRKQIRNRIIVLSKELDKTMEKADAVASSLHEARISELQWVISKESVK